jgi:uncharacterized integral membrane protein
VGIGALVLLVVVFAVANLEDAEVSLVFHTFTVPLVVVIIGSALVGWVIGWFMGRNRNG